jgi:hypothetical protein
MDPLKTRLDDTNAYRLRCSTESQATVVWVRFVHPDYGIIPPLLTGPPERFRAELTDSNGTTIPLQSVRVRMQSYQRGFYVAGWSVPGALETYRGNLIRISSTNGNEAVTLRVP